MALSSHTTVCYPDLHSTLEDGKVDRTRETNMPLQVIHIFKHLDIATSQRSTRGTTVLKYPPETKKVLDGLILFSKIMV